MKKADRNGLPFFVLMIEDQSVFFIPKFARMKSYIA